jgi:Ser/Thr protein kinase RdoA (MazF antagonist)
VIDLDALAARWSLRDVAIADTRSSYPTRHVFVVDSHRGRFVAKLVTSARDRDRLSLAVQVLDLLADRGFRHAPTVLRTEEGDAVVSTASGSMCLLEFVPGQLTSSGPPSVQTWRALGSVAALLNGNVGITVEYGIPTRSALKELAEWARGRPIESGVLAILERLKGLEDPHPSGLIHGEINEANAATRDDGTVVLLDWDAAGRGETFLEYGYPLITAFVSARDLTFHVTAASAFYRAYVEAGGVIEPSKVFPAALLHALRYMRFADSELRWRRICHALDREEELCSVVDRL